MRFALVTDAWQPQVNGVVRTWTQVVRELEGLGHQCLVIHPGLPGLRTCAAPRYREIRLALFPGPRVRSALRDFAPHAVHIATEGPLGLAARRWCRRARWPFTTSYHTQFAPYLRKYFGVPEGLTYRALRWFHGPAARTLVPTDSVRRELAGHGFEHLVVWCRGVDTQRFAPGDRALFAHLPRPVFLTAGRIAPEKNLEAFLDLNLPGSKVVVGDGPARATLQRRYPQAHFTGYLKDEALAQHYAAADVFVFPSRTDTFGVVMLEAGACGLPVAAFPVTGPRDVVRPGVTGVLAANFGVACLEALKLDPAACRAYALECSWRRCASMVLDSLAPIGPAPEATAPPPGALAPAPLLPPPTPRGLET